MRGLAFIAFMLSMFASVIGGALLIDSGHHLWAILAFAPSAIMVLVFLWVLGEM